MIIDIKVKVKVKVEVYSLVSGQALSHDFTHYPLTIGPVTSKHNLHPLGGITVGLLLSAQLLIIHICQHYPVRYPFYAWVR